MKRFIGLIGLLCLIGGSMSAQETPADGMNHRIIGYFSSWSIYGRQYFATDIPADKLTHINYAFFNISDEGECVLGDEWADVQYPYELPDGDTVSGNFGVLQALKEQNPNLQTLMSVGGWTWSGKFSDVALTEESRQKFAASCVTLMTRYGFDGIDIDWEYPVGGGLTDGRPEDTANFTLLLAEFRAQLDVQAESEGRVYLLTIAAPAGKSNYSNIALDEIHPYLDWINLMAYDFAGGWSTLTNHHARLFASPNDPQARQSINADAAVQAYLDAGIPADKLVLGVPFYGHGWAGVKDGDTHGLYQSYTAQAPGKLEAGFFDYRDLTDDAYDSYTRYWDEDAQAAWMFDPAAGIVISYEDPQSLQAKADYVQEHHLGGIMFWELSNDDDAHTLLAAVYAALNP